MQTQREPQGEHVNYLLPPLSLTFTVFQQFKNRCDLEVSAYSGMHQFMRRRVELFYDSFDEIPVAWIHASCRWLLWLSQFEAERRGSAQARRRRDPLRVPDWPSPNPRPTQVLDVEF